MFPSHLEIKFFPTECEIRDFTIDQVCSEVRQVIDRSIDRSLDYLHYNKKKVLPAMCFRCSACHELHQIKKGLQSGYKVFCKKDRKTSLIPPQGMCWYSKG